MRRIRLSAVLTRRPRPVVIALAGLTATVAALVSVYGSTYDGANAGATVGPAGCFVGIEWRGEPGVYGSCTGADPDSREGATASGPAFHLDFPWADNVDADTATPEPAPAPAADDVVTAYNAGWKAGVDALGHGTHATPPAASGDANDAGTVAWADGWIDGQADAMGDDDRDGTVEPGESGWDASTARH
ncbi:hypothetical protein [Streptomyces sp. NPDC001068]|uniref:hypothetical protein n=1 Tax=Streptomyces sp. NPDC001068 TaxID=3364544 RepID=UPI0036B59309